MEKSGTGRLEETDTSVRKMGDFDKKVGPLNKVSQIPR